MRAIVGHGRRIKTDVVVDEEAARGRVVAQRSDALLKAGHPQGTGRGSDGHGEQHGDTRCADLSQHVGNHEELISGLVHRTARAGVVGAKVHQGACWSARVVCRPSGKVGEHLVSMPPPVRLVEWRHDLALVSEARRADLVPAPAHRADPPLIDTKVEQRAPQPIAPTGSSDPPLRDAVADGHDAST